MGTDAYVAFWPTHGGSRSPQARPTSVCGRSVPGAADAIHRSEEVARRPYQRRSSRPRGHDGPPRGESGQLLRSILPPPRATSTGDDRGARGARALRFEADRCPSGESAEGKTVPSGAGDPSTPTGEPVCAVHAGEVTAIRPPRRARSQPTPSLGPTPAGQSSAPAAGQRPTPVRSGVRSRRIPSGVAHSNGRRVRPADRADRGAPDPRHGHRSPGGGRGGNSP